MDAQSVDLRKWIPWMMPRKKASTKEDKEPEVIIKPAPSTPATPEDLGEEVKEVKKKPNIIDADVAFNKVYDAA